MKKITSILLLMILTFNWFGYRLLVYYMEGKADTQLVQKLDDNTYDESQLISVKMPAAHLSGYIHSGSFERVNGQLEMNGVTYNYVKIKLYSDSLELMCIPNRAATKVKTAKNDYYKLVNDIQQKENKKQGQASVKNGPGDFVMTDLPVFLCNTAARSAQATNINAGGKLPFAFGIPIENPPEKNS